MTAPQQRAPAADAPTISAIAAGGGLSGQQLIEIAANRGAGGDCLCFEGELAEVVVVALVAQRTRIGRGLAADVQLDDPTVSRRHALIVRDDRGWLTVLDERSLNGVVVNGRRVSSHRLEHGDEILLGRRRLCYARLAGTAAEAEPSPERLRAA